MQKRLIALAAVAAALAAPLAQAQDTGSYIVRARALHLDAANKSGVAGLGVENKTFPEVDISYFFTPNLAAELILTYPQKHDVNVGAARLGSLKHLPPTLSLQYHVTGLGNFRPYVGAGLNYTRLSSVDLKLGADTLAADKNSWGLAFGVGADYALGGGWLLNVDVKKVHIHTDITNASKNGAYVTTLKVDPTLVSVGVGYRF